MKSPDTKKSQKPLLLAIHGFTGEPYDFSPFYENSAVVAEWRFVDLPGHFRNGESVPELSGQWKEFVSRIDQVVREGVETQRKVYVLAYSMGARLFLKALLEEKWNLGKMILIGATAGLESGSERTERLENDRLLAEKLRHDGINRFIDEWMEQPIIQSQMRTISPERISGKKQLNAEALADALLEFSNGAMAPLWNRLNEISCDTLLVAGERDEKFRSIHERMVKLIPLAQIQVVTDAGHAPHLENADAFSKILGSCL